MDSNACLSIKTSVQKAIELYPLTRSGEFLSQENDFLINFFIEFYNPYPNNATLKRKFSIAPREDWFLLFDEVEKEILSDEYAFYGIRYRTSARLAVKRLADKIKKLESFVEQPQPKTKKSRFYVQGAFMRRDYVKDMQEALKLFNPEDEITMNFVVAEWPSEREMEQKEYIKHFEDKIFRKGKYVNDDIPF